MAQQVPLPLTVSCSSKIQIGFTFLVPAHPGSPGQRDIKRMCVLILHYCYTRITASFPGQPGMLVQKGKTILDLNESRDDGVLGSNGISWTICKQSAPCSRQITPPAPHHSQTGCSSWCPTNSQALKAKYVFTVVIVINKLHDVAYICFVKTAHTHNSGVTDR